MSAPRRIHIDSRFAQRVGSELPRPSRFRIDFPSPCEYLSETTRLYVDHLTLTQTLGSLHATRNTLYHTEYDGTTYSSRVLGLAEGNYDVAGLVALLTTNLNAGSPALSYTVVETDNKLTIAGTGPVNSGWRIWGYQDLLDPLFASVWTAVGGDASELVPEVNAADTFGIPSNFDPQIDVPGIPPSVRVQSTLVTGHIDARGCHEIFLACPQLARDDTLVGWGASSIIKRFPVNEAYGGLIQSIHSGLAEDHVDLGVARFRSLDFVLYDAFGVELVGLTGYVSFTLLLVE
jgi:hypothetical protein